MTNLGIFKFTGRRRYVLTITFTALNFIQIILGLLMTGGSLYIVIGVSGKFYSEKAEITFVFTVTGMFGTHVVITYLVGIKIGDKCYNLAHKQVFLHLTFLTSTDLLIFKKKHWKAPNSMDNRQHKHFVKHCNHWHIGYKNIKSHNPIVKALIGKRYAKLFEGPKLETHPRQMAI